MTRFLSVWLTNFPIERLRRIQRRGAGANRQAVSSHGHRPHEARIRAPFALAHGTARGVIITAVNASARKAGIQPGQSVADARAVCPVLRTVPAELDRDAAALAELAVWFARYGPQRGTDGDEGLWVNVTGVGHLFSGEQDLMADAIARLQRAGFGARAAIADTPGAAHALARYATNPDRPTALAAPCETVGALAPLPIEALRLEADCVLLLKRLGLHRIGQLLALPRAALARRFRDAPRGSAKARKSARDDLARAVVWRLDQALGHVREPKAPIVPPPRFIARQTFTEPLISSDGIMQASAALAGDLCSALSEASDGAFGLRLSLFRADGTTAHVEIGASRPTADPEHMVGLLREPLEAVDAGLGIDLMTLDALRTAPMIAGQCALSAGDGGPAGDATARLVDRLSNRLGAEAVARFDARNTHLPERAEGHRPAVTAAKPAGAQSQSPQALLDVPLPDQALRPAFLLPAPEPITVIAELPEGPPARFQWRRLSCRIHRAIGPERITPEWWRALEAYRDSEAARAAEEADADTASAGKDPGGAAETEPVCATTGLPGRVVTKSAVPRVRDYYVLEADHGGRYWAFRDGLYQREAEDGAPQWYMQGVFG